MNINELNSDRNIFPELGSKQESQNWPINGSLKQEIPIHKRNFTMCERMIMN
jgi:hypothetical protein